MAEPEFGDVLAAAAHLQELFDDAVLVGGTAAAVHAAHRVSFDADHVLTDLRERFDALLDALETTDGWATARVTRPVLVLGRLDGIETGIRQLIRRRPLEVEVVEIDGSFIRIPTLPEMARIKAWLLATRHSVRDYLDTVVLFERLGEDAVAAALRDFDAIYRQPGAASPLSEVAERLAAAAPSDRAAIDLRSYRGLISPWSDWRHLAERGRRWAKTVARVVLEARP